MAAMPEMMEKMEKNYNTQLENFKTEAKEIVGKSWAEVVKGDQKKIIKEVVENSSESALKKSMSLIDSNLTEMRNRVNNLIISNATENENADLTTSVFSILSPVADIPRADLVKVVRLGKLTADRNRPRPILVTLRHEEDAKFLHNYKAGRKVQLEDNSGHLWINADLTKTERDVAYQRRREHRARRETAARVVNTGGGPREDGGQNPAQFPAPAAESLDGQQPPQLPPQQPDTSNM